MMIKETTERPRNAVSNSIKRSKRRIASDPAIAHAIRTSDGFGDEDDRCQKESGLQILLKDVVLVPPKREQMLQDAVVLVIYIKQYDRHWEH